MKTTKKKTIAARSLCVAILSQLLLLASCQQADEPQPAPQQGKPLRLVSGIATIQTRAFDTSWDNTDEIGVFTVKAGSTAASDITYSGTNPDANVKYKIASTAFSGTETSVDTYDNGSYTFKTFNASGSTEIYLPADGANVDVYAYYPWTMGVSASAPLEINIPTTQHTSNQKAIDVMKASYITDLKANPARQVNIDNTSAQLTFSHIMSKVLVRVIVGEGYGASDLNGTNISSVVLSGQPTAATFAPVTQALTITTASNPITMAELPSTDADYAATASVSLTENAAATTEAVVHNYRAIILPNMAGTNPKTTGSERQLQFNVGSVTYTYDIKEEFQPGQQTVYNIILAANEVTVEATITAWTTNTTQPEKPLLPINN